MSHARNLYVYGAVAVLLSLALARVHPFGNAGLYAAKDVETPILEHSAVPPEARGILVAKCANCHSNQTRSPFYGRFAPTSWLMERDLIKGREAMNFSIWNGYSAEHQQAMAAKIVQETREHKMPPLQYRVIHWKSGIADSEIRILTNWAHAMSGPATAEADQSYVEGDPSRGKGLFEKRCTGCHSLTQNREGPKLHGVYGRTSGTVADYAYSPALKNAHVTWNEESLGKWLADPDAFIAGNDMDFLISKTQERLDLISFLKQNSGK